MSVADPSGGLRGGGGADTGSLREGGVLGIESWGQGEQRKGETQGQGARLARVRVPDSGLGPPGSSPGFVVTPQISVFHLGLPDKIQDS